MSTLRKTSVLTVALALVLALLIGVVAMFGGKAANGVTGPEVNPILVAGNPTCADRGFAHELKIEAVDLDNKTYSDGILSVTISNLQYNSENEAVKFDWKSNNYAVDEVLVKASNNANAFVYDPPKESMGDDGLYGPENKGISHINFCYDIELKVEKTANTSLTRTHTWTIDKTANKDKVTLPGVGQSSPVDYSVKVDQTSKDSEWKVDGTITVTAPVDFTVQSVTDTVSPDIAATVDCDKTLPAALTAGQTLTCDYSANLPDATTRTNTATAKSGTTDVKDGTGTAQVDFAKATVNEIDEQINVKDSLVSTLNATVNAADAPKTIYYTGTVGSYEQCGKYDVPNTASFTTNDTKTTGEDKWNVAVTVLCKVNVEKTVSGKAPSGTQAFTFQLRQGASTTQNGTILATQVANAANGGMINFSGLVPGDTYQLCEIVMPGWSTNFGTLVPASFYPPEGVVPDPNVDNSILCANFKAEGQTFKIDNTPPPGGRALTIGFWKNWASCATSGGKQKPVLDQTLAMAQPTGEVISATGGSYPAFGAPFYLVLHGNTSTPNSAPDCLKAVRLLNKSTTDAGKKMASDPAFNLAAQLVAAELNYTAGAGRTPAATNAITQAVLLLGKYQFNGSTYTPPKISAADATTMNNLAKILDDYNNDR